TYRFRPSAPTSSSTSITAISASPISTISMGSQPTIRRRSSRGLKRGSLASSRPTGSVATSSPKLDPLGLAPPSPADLSPAAQGIGKAPLDTALHLYGALGLHRCTVRKVVAR